MADIICFPQARNVGKARHVAVLFLKKRTERERRSYWSTICNGLARAMWRAGFPQEEIDHQVEAFRCAVEWEIDTINQYNGYHNGPGAA